MLEMFHSAGEELWHAGALRYLFPLLAIVGPVICFRSGYSGIVKRKTLVLGRSFDGSLGEPATVEGAGAVVEGVLNIVIGLVCMLAMWPIVGAMFGLW